MEAIPKRLGIVAQLVSALEPTVRTWCWVSVISCFLCAQACRFDSSRLDEPWLTHNDLGGQDQSGDVAIDPIVADPRVDTQDIGSESAEATDTVLDVDDLDVLDVVLDWSDALEVDQDTDVVPDVVADQHGDPTPDGDVVTDVVDLVEEEIPVEPLTAQFEIQRGTTIIDDAQLSATILAGTDYQIPEGPAFVRLVNTRLAGMGRTSDGGRRNTNRWMVWVEHAQPIGTSITFRRFDASDNCRITWEIIEYTGGEGELNEMAVRQTGTAVYSNDALTTTTVSIEGIENDSDVVVFITGQASPEGGNDSTFMGLSTSNWLSESQEAQFTRRGSNDAESIVSYAVVEFVGDNWSVQRVEHEFGISLSEQTSISSVGDTNRAFLHAQFRTDNGDVDELGGEAWLDSPALVAFALEVGASTDITSVVWVISNSQTGEGEMVVTHFNGVRADGTTEEDTWTVPADPPVDPSNSSIMGECARTSGADNKVPRGSISLTLIDDGASVELKQSDNGGTRTYRFSIVEWPLG